MFFFMTSSAVRVIHNFNSLTMIKHNYHVFQSTAVIVNNQTSETLGNRDFFQLYCSLLELPLYMQHIIG